ncbi:MAG: cytochrome c [Flavobacteriales bacterium]|nr:cytochrome c [Flavobacteriales bacterium]
MLLALLGLVALLACGGGDTAQAGAAAPRADAAVDGRQLYVSNCQLCHGDDGKLGLNNAKDLTASTLSRAEMVAIVKYGRNAMTPFRHILSPAEVDAVVDYVRTLKTAE